MRPVHHHPRRYRPHPHRCPCRRPHPHRRRPCSFPRHPRMHHGSTSHHHCWNRRRSHPDQKEGRGRRLNATRLCETDVARNACRSGICT